MISDQPPKDLRAKKTWKYYLFGRNKPSKEHVVAVGMIWASLPWLIYQRLHMTSFFPSTLWQYDQFWLAAVSGMLFVLVSYKVNLGRKLGKRMMIFGSLFLAFYFWMSLMGLSSFYTRNYGTPHSQVITVSEHKSSSRAGHCVKSEVLNTGFKRFCGLNHDLMRQMPARFPMLVTGKKTWFGFAIENYTLPKVPSPAP